MSIHHPVNLVDKVHQAMQQSQCGVNTFGPVYDENVLAEKLRSILQGNLAQTEPVSASPALAH